MVELSKQDAAYARAQREARARREALDRATKPIQFQFKSISYISPEDARRIITSEREAREREAREKSERQAAFLAEQRSLAKAQVALEKQSWRGVPARLVVAFWRMIREVRS